MANSKTAEIDTVRAVRRVPPAPRPFQAPRPGAAARSPLSARVRGAACVLSAALILPLAASAACQAEPPAARHPLPALYVYRWGGCSGVKNLTQFENMLGRPVDGVTDFNDFFQTAGAAASNADWALGCWRGHARNISYRVGLAFKDASIDQVAAGVADATYVHIAQSLVGHGFPHAYVSLGWEMNGGWYPWGRKGPVFGQAFSHVAKIFKAECPGCIVVFNPSAGLDPSAEMPANAEGIDAVGFDDYINTWNAGGATSEPDLFRGNNLGVWGFISGYPDGGRGYYTGGPGGGVVPEYGVGSRSDGHGACPEKAWNSCDDAYAEGEALAAFRAGGVKMVGIWDVNAGDYNSEMSGGERPGEALELIKVYGGGELPQRLRGATLYTGQNVKPSAREGEFSILVQLSGGHVAQLAWGPKPGQSVRLTELNAGGDH